MRELGWQRNQIPVEVRDLVLDDQRRRSAICCRSAICWYVFDD
ncbi:MAG TPA: hypothetical protein VFE92_19740 [Dermatophilaceae bacterium]|nr:hypothetical protein [Dermatophilaceae bacterium]